MLRTDGSRSLGGVCFFYFNLLFRRARRRRRYSDTRVALSGLSADSQAAAMRHGDSAVADTGILYRAHGSVGQALDWTGFPKRNGVICPGIIRLSRKVPTAGLFISPGGEGGAAIDERERHGTSFGRQRAGSGRRTRYRAARRRQGIGQAHYSVTCMPAAGGPVGSSPGQGSRGASPPYGSSNGKAQKDVDCRGSRWGWTALGANRHRPM